MPLSTVEDIQFCGGIPVHWRLFKYFGVGEYICNVYLLILYFADSDDNDAMLLMLFAIGELRMRLKLPDIPSDNCPLSFLLN